MRLYLKVTAYELLLVCGGHETDFRVTGNQLPADALALIKRYNGRIILFFDQVRFYGGGMCPHTTHFSYELF